MTGPQIGDAMVVAELTEIPVDPDGRRSTAPAASIVDYVTVTATEG